MTRPQRLRLPAALVFSVLSILSLAWAASARPARAPHADPPGPVSGAAPARGREAPRRFTVLPALGVEPGGGTVLSALGASSSQTFTIWNNGTSAATFTLAPACDGSVVNCTVPASVTIGAGAAAQVAMPYTASGNGTVRLNVTGNGTTVSGWVSVQTVKLQLSYPVRHLCVTVALPGAASECGDLRIAHPLPAVRTMNRTRAPVLLYNSGLAQPRLRMVINYAPNPAKAPVDSFAITAALANGRSLGEQRWTGYNSQVEWRRVVFSADAADLPTGLYTVNVTFTSWRGGVGTVAGTGQYEVPLVNRGTSRIGAGWWVAGVEEIQHLADGRKFWVSGDGSTGVYIPLNDTTWVAWNLERPDSLKKRTNAQGAIRYVRLLPGGGHVVFGATGQHDSTVTRTHQFTAFTYGANGLATLTVPGGAVYNFQYGSTPRPRLWRVRLDSDTVRRTVQIGAQDGDPRIRTIEELDGGLTSFSYASLTDTTQKRIIKRMDPRRLTFASYTYDAIGKLTQGQLDMGAAGESDDIIVRITPGESRGAAPSPVLFDSVYTLVDGPRPDSDARDVTRFWIPPKLDNSIPQRIVDALGNETVLTYGDARFWALVTRVDGPVLAGGVRNASFASYDARGNLSATVVQNPLGDGRDATTRYERTDAWWPDFVSRVTAPTGEIADFGYDATTGNRLWQQDGRGTASRVQVGYNAAGQPVSVTVPATRTNAAATAGLAYDARGNLRATRSPAGNYTLMYADAFGRDTLVITPASAGDSASVRNRGVRQRMVYDPAGRVTQSITLAPSLNYAPAETLSVVTQYDSAGLVRSVSRRSGPDIHGIGWITSQFRYDAAGRRTVEIAPPYAFADTTFYDPAGNVTALHTRRGGQVAFRYDALGRLVRRETNEDTARFGYDARGNLLAATNLNARITRTYYHGGMLKTDSIRIRTYTPSQADTLWTGYTAHVYGLAYQYDLGGRRTRLTYPANVVAGSGITGLRDHADYGYDPVTGSLAWVEGLGADTRYDYRYDTRDQPDSTYMPGGLREWYLYDDEGRMTRRYTYAPAGGSWFTGGTLRDDYYSYDGRGKMGATATVIGAGGIQTGAGQANTYDGMGNLIGSVHLFDSPYTYENWRSDAMGNRTDVVRFGPTSPGNVTYVSQYEAASGVLKKTVSVGDTTAVADTTLYWYNYGGDNTGVSEYGKVVANPRFGNNISEPEFHQRRVESASYYNNEGRLAEYRRLSSQENGAGLRIREAYAYDALGRRVWHMAYRGWDPGTLTQRDTVCLRPSPPSDCQGFVERTVWDGDQIVAELRAFLYPDGYPADRESDTGYQYSPHYGRVLYTHAGRIDQPVEIVRMDVQTPFVSVPHANWRGTYDVLTMTGTRYAQCGPQVGAPLGTQPECFPFALESVSAFGETAPRNWDGTDTGPRSWSGSLLTGNRDASGMLYRRNRYVDPGTGRFTQEDPIGLAGGLNAYGFGAGDPISYRDPLGLCPDSLKTADQKCPGGLSDEQYDFIEEGVRTNLRNPSDGRILERLQTGRIRLVASTVEGAPAVPDNTTWDAILVTEQFFAENTPGEGIWVLGHESGHMLQWTSGMLIKEFGYPGRFSSQQRMSVYMNADRKSKLFMIVQDDADEYACALVINPGRWGDQC